MKRLVLEQISVLLIHIAMEQGAGGRPALNPQIHPVFSHRKTMVQQEDGRGYVATAEVDSGLKTSFHLFPCCSQFCPSLSRLLAKVSFSSVQTLAQILSHT